MRPYLESHHHRMDRAVGYLFVGPSTGGLLVFVLLPIAAIFFFSLFDWNIIRGDLNFVGLENYTSTIPSDGRLPRIVANSLVFTAAYVPLTVVAGLALAVATNRPVKGMRFFRGLYFMPVVISLAAWTLVWRLLLQPEGPINGIIRLSGFEPVGWLQGETSALVAVIGVAVLKSVGFAMILFHAALQQVPMDLKEAARIDGAGEWSVFRRIIMPFIAPFTFLILILVTINSLRSFTLIYLMTGGGPGDATRVLSFYLFEQGFQFFRMGYASTLSVILFLAVMTLTVVQFSVRRRWVFHENQS